MHAEHQTTADSCTQHAIEYGRILVPRSKAWRHQRLTPPQIYLRNGPEMKALMHLTRLLHPRNSPCQHMNAGKPQECAHVPHDRNRGMNASLTNHAAASVRIARQYTGKRISRDVAELVRAVVDVLQVCVHVRPAAQRDMIFWT